MSAARPVGIKVSDLFLDEHFVGTDCAGCWMGYPVPCQCGGWVHAEHFEEHWDGYELIKRCTRCDDPTEAVP